MNQDSFLYNDVLIFSLHKIIAKICINDRQPITAFALYSNWLCESVLHWNIALWYNIACRRWSNYIFILDLTAGLTGLGKVN